MAGVKRDPVLSSKEASDVLGVLASERTLKRWRQQSEVRGELIGPRWVVSETGSIGYRLSVIEAYLESRTTQLDEPRSR
jgi:hypothetical protein